VKGTRTVNCYTVGMSEFWRISVGKKTWWMSGRMRGGWLRKNGETNKSVGSN